jgi:hypothetical protein
LQQFVLKLQLLQAIGHVVGESVFVSGV